MLAMPESCVRARNVLLRGEKSSMLASISSSFFLLDFCADHLELLRLVKLKEGCWKALENDHRAIQWQIESTGNAQVMHIARNSLNYLFMLMGSELVVTHRDKIQALLLTAQCAAEVKKVNKALGCVRRGERIKGKDKSVAGLHAQAIEPLL